MRREDDMRWSGVIMPKRLVSSLAWLLGAAGPALMVWAFVGPMFRDSEGFATGLIVLPLASGAAALILAAGIGHRWQALAAWLSLALVGQAASLQLIAAGSELRYQHYRPFEQHPWLLIVVAGQLILVAAGFRSRRRPIWRWLRQTFKGWQLILLALLFWLPAATVSAQPAYFLFELAFAAVLQTVNLGNIILVGWSLPDEWLMAVGRRLERLSGPAGETVVADLRLDRFALLLAVWVVIVAALLNVYAYERHPHVPDEFAYIYHARYLAQGVLTMPAPPAPEAFDVYLMAFDGARWYPSPPPGWPALLSLGSRLNAGWLVNPILGGLNLLVVYLLLQALFARRLARLGVFLLAVSPWYLFLAMSYMTHMSTLTAALLATIGVVFARRSGRAWWGWAGGVGLGFLAHIRPLEAAAMAAMLGLWAIGVGGRRLRFPALAGLVLGAMLVGGAALVYNQALTGDPVVFPIMRYTDERFGPNANALGFGPDRGMGWAIDPYPGHSPRDAIINADLNAFAVNIEMYGWSIGSLLFAGLFVVAGRLRRSDYLMLAVIVVIFGLHFFYYFSGGPDFGARYWFLMVVPIVALTARGVFWLAERLEVTTAAPQSGARLLVTIVALCFIALATFLPWRAIDKYHHFRGMRPDIRRLEAEYDFGRSLVLIRGDSHPDYASAAVYNPLDMVADAPIYAWDRGMAARQAVVAAYADRPVWLIDGPTVTGGGFVVTAGPLPAQTLLQDE